MRKTLLTAVGVLILWQIICSLHLVNLMFLSSPYETMKEFIRLATERVIFFDLRDSLCRVFSGVTLSILIGVPIGLTLGYYKNIYAYIPRFPLQK